MAEEEKTYQSGYKAGYSKPNDSKFFTEILEMIGGKDGAYAQGALAGRSAAEIDKAKKFFSQFSKGQGKGQNKGIDR